MELFFTSDMHFGHAKAMEYERAGFKTVEEMDESLMAAWQSVVTKKDTVYVLGDVSFHRPKRTFEILSQLPGRKVLIRGNHDKVLDKPLIRPLFERIEDLLEIKVPDPDAYEGKQRIVLCHYPMISWNASRYGSWMLHGHCHGNLRDDLLPAARRLDVGVDAVGFTPITYAHVKKLMASKSMVAVDHHKPKDWK